MSTIKQINFTILLHLPFLLLALLLVLVSGNGYSDNRIQSSTGFIAAVGIEVDEDGHPMLAEFDSDGFFVGDVGFLGLGELEEVTLYPAASWRAFELFHQNLIDSNPDATLGAKLMSAEQYESRSFSTRTEPKQPIEKPELRENTKSVFVISEDRMLTPNPIKESFILAEYPIALHLNAAIAADTVTLIVNKKSDIVRRSKFDISFKAAIYNEDKRDSRDGFERLWQPIANARVSAGDTDLNLFPGGQTTSQADGRYSMIYSLPPCPGFSYDIDVPIMATIDIQNFNPKATGLGFMTAYRNDPKVCVGYGDAFIGASLQALSAQLEAQAIVATLSTPIYNLDVWFSTMQVNAVGTMPGVKLTGNTKYTEDSQVKRLGEADYSFDFNLDGELDAAVVNPDDENQIFIYFSPNKPKNEKGELNPPDFVRVADYELLSQLDHQGLLSEISKKDLEDTDIYIYRRSTGQLLGSIEGLAEKQEPPDGPIVPGSPNPTGRATYRWVHEDKKDNATFGFTSFLIGAVSNDFRSNIANFQLREKTNRRPWKDSENKANDFTSENLPDGLRPGELIQIIAINRATGYIGSQDIVTQPSGAVFEPPLPILMGPPNLKIIASREFKDINEITLEENKEVNIIGNEGAGLTSDTFVKIQSVWLAQNGDLLPENLPGYTGRVAISTSSTNTKDFSGNFEIKPGYQTQLVQLNNANELQREHFYVQVVGEDFNGTPKFESPGAGDDKLQTRPKKYVPILVPLFDEQSTRAVQDALTLAKKAGVEDLPERAEATYRWVYRPEMQFSVYDFKVQEIRQELVEKELQTGDIFQLGDDNKQDTVPLIASGYDLTRILFELTGQDTDKMLVPFGPERELVLAIGEEEVPVTAFLNAAGDVVFENVEHIAQLVEQDFLAIRLYENSDSYNTLWSFAFEYMGISVGPDPIKTNDFIYVEADEPQLELTAYILGTVENEDSDYKVTWAVESGNASIVDPSQEMVGGAASTILNIDPDVDNEVLVSATLNSSVEVKVLSQNIRVLPGFPAAVDVSGGSGPVYEQGLGSTDLSMTVRDLHGNLVSDGTPVTFMAEGSTYISRQDAGTLDGIATATVKGGYNPGTYQVLAQSGSAETTQSVSVTGINKTFVNVPATATGGESFQISLQANAGGAPAVNTYVQLGAAGAVLENKQLKTDDAGNLDFIVHTSPRGGTVTLTAKTGFANETTASFVVQPLDDSIEPEQPFLVSDTQGLLPPTATSQSVQLKGVAKAAWTLNFDEYHFPNLTPIYLNRFYDLRNDDNHQYVARYNAFKSINAPEYGLSSIDFPSNDKAVSWRLQYADGLAPQHPGIAFWIKVDANGTILRTANNAIELDVSGAQLNLELNADAGQIMLSQTGIVIGQWHRVAFGLDAGRAYLKLDDLPVSEQAIATTLGWQGTVDEDWLMLGSLNDFSTGNRFSGNLSGLRIYDRDGPPVVTLAQTSGTYDAGGIATVRLSTNGGAQSYNGSIVLQNEAGASFPVSILADQHFSRYVNAVEAVYGAGSALQDHVTLSKYLPAEDQPTQSLFDEVASNEDLGALESLLAATAWLDMRHELDEIAPYLLQMQNYYRIFDQQELVFALADELAQSLNEARAGNSMRLLTMRTGLLVWGELLDASPAAANFIAQAIQNKGDLWVWLRYLSLPAKGWSGPSIPIPKPGNTCDRVSPTINVGTILSYNPVPCRATGVLAAEVINNWIAEDEDVQADPRRLTRDIKLLTAGLNGAPLELTKLVFAGGTQFTLASNWNPVGTAKANPLVMAARLLVFALKTGAKLGYRNAPSNLINFFQNRTSSRFDAVVMLGAIAYLESRNQDSPFACENCTHLDPETYDQINKNLRAWFSGLSLASKGTINEDQDRLQCTLSRGAHGAALELVGTAAYHALHEFKDGGSDQSELKILAADKYVRVPFRKEGFFGSVVNAGEGDYGRQPDLILQGGGEKDRYWIEFKSWRRDNSHVTNARKLKDPPFRDWHISRDTRYAYDGAMRQHFIDFTAASGQLESVWSGEVKIGKGSYRIRRDDNLDLRAGRTRTWIQVWELYKGPKGKPSGRQYKVLRKKKPGKGWELKDTKIFAQRARPWIEANGIVTDQKVKSSNFDLLQEYLTRAPDGLGSDDFEFLIGYPETEHNNRRSRLQVGKNNSTVAPFTLLNMLTVEVGEQVAKDTVKKLGEQIANSEFANYLGGGPLTQEQIEALRARLEAEVRNNLGVIGDVLDAVDEVTPDWWLRIEEKLQDAIAGAVGDDARDVIANFELPDVFQEQFCEAVFN